MTIAEMFQQGMVFHIIVMAILFALMGFIISAIGGGKPAAQNTAPDLSKNNKQAITAAIVVAVNQYKKNN